MKSTDRFILWVWGAILAVQIVVGLFVRLTSFTWLIFDEVVIAFAVVWTVAFKMSKRKKSRL